jgi:glutathione S-transferase
MLKLYGFPVSNYFNMVKLALLEKGLAFEEIAARPSQEGAYKAKSPMGKVPCVEVAEGFISETGVILDYLEEQQPGHLPQSAFGRAKAREFMRVLELYIELPGRRHFGHVFFGGPKSEAAVEEVRPTVEKGLVAVQQLMGEGEWLCGDQFSLVDIYAYYTLGYAAIALKAVYGWDIVAEVPGLGAVLERIKARAATQQVDAAQQAAFAAMSAK